ncbi:putative signal transducing protein [Bacterioplanoides pacificum]|uniref:DUF2007 domain-containing protein n=1 Tax=Bacterioplanoides pacificum TaxID=1171596 RepID=A0ABV7VRT1_9GAMM
MKCVYNAADMLEAHVLVGLLQQHKIAAFIEGEYLTGGVGDLATHNYVRVMVNNDDFDRGRQLALEYDQANSHDQQPLPDWRLRYWPWFILALAGLLVAEVLRYF